MPDHRRYEPPSDDNLSRGFDTNGMISEHLRGTDQFLDVVTWNIRFFSLP